MVDAQILKENCLTYFNSGARALDVLRKADGIRNYRDIAKGLGLHPTKVSHLLSKAHKLDLASLIKKGSYKKIPGILGFMPKLKKKREKTVDQDLIKKKMMGKNFSFEKKQNSLETKDFKKVKDKSGKMARAYMWLYITENVLRNLIRNVFRKEEDWWEKRVNATIKKSVEENRLKEKYFSPKRDDNLEYTHLGQLKEIIVSKRNWPLFLSYLKEKEIKDFEINFKKVMPSRHAIAHCIPLREKDYKAIEIRFGDVLDMIK